MKTAILVSLLSLSAFSYAEEKLYLPLDQLSFTENGIFLGKDGCILQLPAVGYDSRGYYLASDSKNGITFVECYNCGLITWWVEEHCCYNRDCVRYCFK